MSHLTSSVPRGGGQLEAVGLTQSTRDQTVFRTTWKLGQVGQAVSRDSHCGTARDTSPCQSGLTTSVPVHPSVPLQSPQHPLTLKMEPVSCRQFSSVTSVSWCCPSPHGSPLPPLPHASRRKIHQPAPHTASPYLSHPHTSLYTPCPAPSCPATVCWDQHLPGLSLDPTARRV